MSGRTLGVIGVGRIGRRLARLARSLDMRVVGTDVDPRAVLRARTSAIRMSEPERLLARSDAVAVCASHRFGGAPLLGSAELAMMRPGALLIEADTAMLPPVGAQAGCDSTANPAVRLVTSACQQAPSGSSKQAASMRKT